MRVHYYELFGKHLVERLVDCGKTGKLTVSPFAAVRLSVSSFFPQSGVILLGNKGTRFLLNGEPQRRRIRSCMLPDLNPVGGGIRQVYCVHICTVPFMSYTRGDVALGPRLVTLVIYVQALEAFCAHFQSPMTIPCFHSPTICSCYSNFSCTSPSKVVTAKRFVSRIADGISPPELLTSCTLC